MLGEASGSSVTPESGTAELGPAVKMTAIRRILCVPGRVSAGEGGGDDGELSNVLSKAREELWRGRRASVAAARVSAGRGKATEREAKRDRWGRLSGSYPHTGACQGDNTGAACLPACAMADWHKVLQEAPQFSKNFANKSFSHKN